MSTISAQIGLPGSNLACNDGTNLNLDLDVTSLLGLSDAVSAINFFPAGDPALGCSVSPQADPSGGNGPKDFAVGGGRIVTAQGTFNFAINARATSDAPAVVPQQGVGGTVNITFTGDNSHLDTKVDCFVSPATGGGGVTLTAAGVVGSGTPGTAQATAVVKKSTGSFAALYPVGSEVRWDFFDSGVPGSAPNGDGFNGFATTAPCAFNGYSTEPITNGTVDVRNDD